MTGNIALAAHLFFQLAIVLAACRLVGRALRPLGQTQVIGEMVAGILLGPSLLGLLAPAAQAWLFPPASMTIIYVLGQLGLVPYMFLVGLDLDRDRLTQHGREAVSVSLSGIAVPVLLGGALGVAVAGDPQLFGPHVAPLEGGLLLAAAMSVTAFPVLARILTDSGLLHTKVGTLAIGAAAVDDAAAWSLLACVLAVARGTAAVALLTIAGGALYALGMIVFGRRLFAPLADAVRADGTLRRDTLVAVLVVIALAAWVTDWIGIHSVFGAFVVGAVMPRGRFRDTVRAAIEPVTVTVLVPIFFAYSGLHTRLSLLVQPSLLPVAAITIVLAFLCKGGTCLLAARAVGTTWREAAAIGVLMNARGLMELVLANIALDKGLIAPGLFAILVVMTIVTTMAASPLHAMLARAEPSTGAAREAAGVRPS